MALAANVVTKIWQGWLRIALKIRGTACVWGKPDLTPVPQAVDDWFTANAASYNSALPQPFRGTATADEKALMLALCAFGRMTPEFRDEALGAMGELLNGS